MVPNPDPKNTETVVFFDQSVETLRAAPTQLNGEFVADSVEMGSSRERAPGGREKGVHNGSGPITEI